MWWKTALGYGAGLLKSLGWVGAGIGAVGVADATFNGPDGIVGNGLEKGGNTIKNPDAITDVDHAFTKFGRTIQNFMKLFQNFWGIVTGTVDMKTVFTSDTPTMGGKASANGDGPSRTRENTIDGIGNSVNNGLNSIGIDSPLSNTTTGTVATLAGLGATGYLAKKALSHKKPIFDVNKMGESAQTNTSIKPAKTGFFSKLTSKLGRFGKILTLGTVGVGATGATLGLTSQSAEAGELPNTKITTATPTVAEVDKGLFQESVDVAHSLAHGFTEELSETGASIAGHFADAVDWASGKTLSIIGVDTGYKERNLSDSWAQEAEGLADKLLGTPDLSSSFSKVAHDVGGVASWLVGPVAFGTAKIFNAGAKAVTKVGFSSPIATYSAGGAAVLSADNALSSNNTHEKLEL